MRKKIALMDKEIYHLNYLGNYLLGMWSNCEKKFLLFGTEERLERVDVYVLGFVKQQPPSKGHYRQVDIREPVNRNIEDFEVVRTITYKGNPDWIDVTLSMSLPDGKRTLPHGSITVETVEP